MGLVHILLEDGQQPAYEEDQIRAMLLRGDLSPATYFWREGMPEWLPLSELPDGAKRSIAPPRRTRAPEGNSSANFTSAVRETSRPAQSTASTLKITSPVSSGIRRRRSSGYHLKKSYEPIATFLLTALAISMGAALFNLWFDSSYMLAGLRGTLSENVTHLYRTEKYFLLLTYLEALISSQLLYFIWIYTANDNSRGFVGNLKYTPGWAVGYYFIPGICYVRPYQVMQEIWRVSEDPQTWQNKRPSIFIIFWWGLWLISWIMYRGNLIFVNRAANPTSTSFTNTFTNLIAADVDFVLIALTTLIIVAVVTWRHKRLARGTPEEE